jgi:hypothetical protein
MPRSIDRRSLSLLLWQRAVGNHGRVVLFSGLLALAATAGGCRRELTWNLAPVEGTITKDGRPLVGIEVVFWTDIEAGTQGPPTSGVTDAAGHYELHTDAGDRGAVVGRYRVCLYVPRRKDDLRGKDSTRQAKLPKKDRAAEPPVSGAVQLPPVCSSFEKTPLRVEVRLGPQVIDLEVK